jgi:predicted XRE-type DNA-binding protein
MKKIIEHEVSSGNVFADLELPDAEELFLKAGIVFQINELIDQKKLSKAAARKLFNIDQSRIAALRSGKLSDFSIVELFKFLNTLDQDYSKKRWIPAFAGMTLKGNNPSIIFSPF